MTEIRAPKIVSYVAVGPEGDEITVPKLVAYVFAIPGVPPGEPEPTGRVSVHTQIIRRR